MLQSPNKVGTNISKMFVVQLDGRSKEVTSFLAMTRRSKLELIK